MIPIQVAQTPSAAPDMWPTSSFLDAQALLAATPQPGSCDALNCPAVERNNDSLLAL
jgi:hypothetical protein